MKEIEKEESSPKKSNPKSAVETNIKEIAEMMVNQYILQHLDVDDIGKNIILEVAVKELHYIVGNLKNRWRNKFNYVNFLTQTMVIQLTKHFEAQHMYFSNEDKNASFLTFSHLKSPDCEEQYMRRLATVVTRYLLPEEYQRSSLSQILAQDILTKFLILPIINQVTDPHFLNLQCIANLKKENGERFNTDPIILSRWRHVKSEEKTCQITPDNILSFKCLADSATDEETLQNVLSSLKQNLDLIVGPDQACLPLLLQAKTTCHLNLQDSETVSLASILSSPVRRKFMSDFLEEHEEGSLALLSLWEEIERLKGSEKHSSLNIGTSIFLTYLTPVPILALENNILQRVEEFLMGGPGGDQGVFLEIQSEISKHIKTYFYSDFCGSEFYLDMIRVCRQDPNITDNPTAYLRRAFKKFNSFYK